jgi:hypothetical protein
LAATVASDDSDGDDSDDAELSNELSSEEEDDQPISAGSNGGEDDSDPDVERSAAPASRSSKQLQIPATRQTNRGVMSKVVDRDEDDEAILVRAKRPRPVDDNEVEDSAGPLLAASDAAGLSAHERARIRRIEADVRLLGAGGAHTDAAGLTPFQRLSLEKAKPAAGKSGSVPLAAAAEAYASRVAARLAATADADRERERTRVRTKHREERLARKTEARGETETGSVDAEDGAEDDAEDGVDEIDEAESDGDTESDDDTSVAIDDRPPNEPVQKQMVAVAARKSVPASLAGQKRSR